MFEQKLREYEVNPRFLFKVTLWAVFLAELLVMFFLHALPEIAPVEEAFLDAFLLASLVVPFLYFLFLKPLQRNIHLRVQTEIEREKIQEIDRSKTEFISIAAHELCTPLTAIMGYSELLLTDNQFDGASRKEFATIINQKADMMERLIDDLLDFSRIESGRPLQVQKDKCDIVLTMAMVLKEYQETHPQRSFDVHLPTVPVSFFFDKVRIGQVLGNILSNAIKFSSAEAPINIECALRDEDFQVRIRDWGIGMTPEELCRVFDKFYRADSSDTSAAGLGLGMAIAKEIIVSHGGEIWLESMPGVGTTVSFTLPVEQKRKNHDTPQYIPCRP